MRLVFMGTPDIARTCLEAIYNAGHEIAGVYTKIDTPKNRGMKLSVSPVKEFALEKGLPVFQPRNFKDPATVEELRALRPELIVVVADGRILPQSVLDVPEKGCINMHASILPQLRGAGPIQWSILNHCEETGITAMYLTAGMDEGDIIEIRRTPIDPMETGAELMARMAQIAAGLACDTIAAIEAGTATRTPQNHAEATYAPMLSKEMSPIDWTQPVRYVIDQVRGLIPWPVATAELAGKRFKISSPVSRDSRRLLASRRARMYSAPRMEKPPSRTSSLSGSTVSGPWPPDTRITAPRSAPDTVMK